jgi:hypothetical protein
VLVPGTEEDARNTVTACLGGLESRILLSCAAPHGLGLHSFLVCYAGVIVVRLVGVCLSTAGCMARQLTGGLLARTLMFPLLVRISVQPLPTSWCKARTRDTLQHMAGLFRKSSIMAEEPPITIIEGTCLSRGYGTCERAC